MTTPPVDDLIAETCLRWAENNILNAAMERGGVLMILQIAFLAGFDLATRVAFDDLLAPARMIESLDRAATGAAPNDAARQLVLQMLRDNAASFVEELRDRAGDRIAP